MRNKQDITVNKVSSLLDLMRDGDCRRLRYASPTVNKVSPLQGFSLKSRRDGILLTVGEAEGVTCGSKISELTAKKTWQKKKI
jgi:hypothetical protein